MMRTLVFLLALALLGACSSMEMPVGPDEFGSTASSVSVESHSVSFRAESYGMDFTMTVYSVDSGLVQLQHSDRHAYNLTTSTLSGLYVMAESRDGVADITVSIVVDGVTVSTASGSGSATASY